jgi:hypothetical protein
MSMQRSEQVIEGEVRSTRVQLPTAGVVLVGTLLAAILGMTSTASPWLSGSGAGPSPPPVVGQVLAVALAAGLCALLGLMWIRTPSRTKARKVPRNPDDVTEEVGSGLRGGVLALGGGMLVVAVLVAAFWFLLGQADSVQVPPLSGTASDDPSALPKPAPPSSAPPVLDWFFVALVASTAVVLPLALIVRRRLRVADPEPEADVVPDSVVRAVGDSIDEIRRDPDPRRAIIRAYASMEFAFDDAGIPRRPYEAPFEYLGRALGVMRVSSAAAGRLAALFERARFSQHVVGTETKNDAVGALLEVERQLQGPPT